MNNNYRYLNYKNIIVISVAIIILLFALNSATTTLFNGEQTLFNAEENNATEVAQPIISGNIAHGGKLYNDWKQYPYDFAIYGPLTYEVPGLIGRVTNMNGVDIWILGRCVSLASGVLVLFLAAFMWRKQDVRWWLIVIGVLTLIPVFKIWNIAFSFRPDMPAISLGMAGLALSGCRNKKSELYVIPFFIAALAYKMPFALCAPLSLALSLYINKTHKRAYIFATTFSIIFITYQLTMGLATKGHFWQHTLLVVISTPFSGSQILEVVRAAVSCTPPAVLPGLLYIVQIARRRPVCPVNPLIFCSIFSVLMGITLSGRIGADINYFIEGIIYLIILSILWIEKFLKEIDICHNVKPIQAFVGGVMAVSLISIAPNKLEYAPPFSVVADFYGEKLGNLGKNKIFPGILSSAVIADLPHPYSDGYLVDSLIKSGSLSGQDLVRNIRNDQFDYAIMPLALNYWKGYAYIPDIVTHDLSDRRDAIHNATLSLPEGELMIQILLLKKNLAITP